MESYLNIKYIVTIIKFLIKRRKVNSSINYKELKTLFFLNSYSESYCFYNTFFSRHTPVFELNKSLDQSKYSLIEFKKKELPKSNAEHVFLDSVTFPIFKTAPELTKYFTVDFTAFTKTFFKNISFIRQNKYFFFRLYKIEKKYYLVFTIPTLAIHNFNTRKYIPNGFTRVSFVEFLKKENINSVVLRWFDKLSQFDDLDEDIDILVDDNDVDKVFNILNSEIGFLPVDLYSVSGDKGTSFAGIPYYPPQMSQNILAHKVAHSEGFYIPNSKWYSLSIIYHIVFHKATKSSIPINAENKTNYKDHNYHEVISNAIVDSKIEINKITLENLFSVLGKFDVLPEYDVMLKLSTIVGVDDWYKTVIEKYRQEILKDFSYIKGLCVFLIREKAYSDKNIQLTKDALNDFGFDLLSEGYIAMENQLDASMKIRGGNWGKGDFQVSGGIPVYYFVTFDPFFVAPNSKILSKHSALENKKVVLIKDKLRTIFRNQHELNLYFNGIHSSDDFYDAVLYLKYLFYSNKDIKAFIASTEKINKEYIPKYQVLEDLSRNSSRAKTLLINYDGKKAIFKIFKKNKTEYLNREVAFLKRFSNLDYVPKLYNFSDNYVIMEYFENAINLEVYTKPIDLNTVKEFKNIVATIFKNNYTLIDLNPSNVLMVDGNLRIIDFEFATEYEETPSDISKAYEISKLPIDFKGDKPIGIEDIKDAYNLYWADKFSLTKAQFLEL